MDLHLQTWNFAVGHTDSSRLHCLWNCEIGIRPDDPDCFEDQQIGFSAVLRHVGDVSTPILREIVKLFGRECNYNTPALGLIGGDLHALCARYA